MHQGTTLKAAEKTPACEEIDGPVTNEMKNGFCSANALNGIAALPFVIPSAAEGSAVPRTIPGNVFRRSEGIMGLGARQDDEERLQSSDRSSWNRRSPLCHPEQLNCPRQIEREMTPEMATDARPGGPTAKRQPSPEGLGNQSRRGSERRRCGTVSLGAQPRACPERSRRGPAVPRTLPGNVFREANGTGFTAWRVPAGDA